ncbi:hypothetical protein [Zavarzinia sp. CC-PAN008]|uniref:hypothetical protein n=1 Tax=Zavarzinia sp. CC-PAN008 TaxID=3243332 RepID=UPI003F742B8E
MASALVSDGRTIEPQDRSRRKSVRAMLESLGLHLLILLLILGLSHVTELPEPMPDGGGFEVGLAFEGVGALGDGQEQSAGGDASAPVAAPEPLAAAAPELNPEAPPAEVVAAEAPVAEAAAPVQEAMTEAVDVPPPVPESVVPVPTTTAPAEILAAAEPVPVVAQEVVPRQPAPTPRLKPTPPPPEPVPPPPQPVAVAAATPPPRAVQHAPAVQQAAAPVVGAGMGAGVEGPAPEPARGHRDGADDEQASRGSGGGQGGGAGTGIRDPLEDAPKLTAQQVRLSLVGNTLDGKSGVLDGSTGRYESRMSVYYDADGTARLKVSFPLLDSKSGVVGTREIESEGRWWQDGDTWCQSFKRIDNNAKDCFRIHQNGNRIGLFYGNCATAGASLRCAAGRLAVVGAILPGNAAGL